MTIFFTGTHFDRSYFYRNSNHLGAWLQRTCGAASAGRESSDADTAVSVQWGGIFSTIINPVFLLCRRNYE